MGSDFALHDQSDFVLVHLLVVIQVVSDELSFNFVLIFFADLSGAFDKFLVGDRATSILVAETHGLDGFLIIVIAPIGDFFSSCHETGQQSRDSKVCSHVEHSFILFKSY